MQRKIDSHKSANWLYADEGIRIPELANMAWELHEKQDMHEKWRLWDIVFSNSIRACGELTPITGNP